MVLLPSFSGADTAKNLVPYTLKLPINCKPKNLQVKFSLISVKLAKVDATVDPKVAGQYKVQGYPTIFFFHKGEKIDYNGQRTKEYLVNWLLKKTRDPLVPVDQAGYEKLKSEDKVSIIFHGDASSTEGQIVSKLAVADDYNSNKCQ
jgi:thioredoxin-like negative regulator of GroEL